MQSKLFLCATVLVALASAALAGTQAQKQPKFKDLKFSKDEVELLKRIKQIEDGANVSTSMLKTAPFIQIFSSTSPEDLVITIFTNDWDQIGPALKALGKIKSCQVVKEIDLFTVDVAGEPAKNPNAGFFGALRSRYD